jgi:hypothetical protein
MTRRAITVVALALAVSAGVPAVVVAASGPTASQAISDCYNHDQLTRYYPPQVLRTALATMPADVREYSDCYDVIERQLFKELGKSTSGTATPSAPSSSSSFLPTWLIVVIVLLALAAITFGALAIRRRSAEGDEPPAAGPGRPGGDEPPAPGAGGHGGGA